jgi:Family of unknown function (DUF6009)
MSTKDIRYETRIIWDEDISRLDYVREGIYLTTRQRGPVRTPGRRVGYAEIAKPKTTRGLETVRRRIFWLMPHDRDSDPSGCYARGRLAPAEAVDPRTVSIGVLGKVTSRVLHLSIRRSG